jgi:hypothetical protein
LNSANLLDSLGDTVRMTARHRHVAQQVALLTDQQPVNDLA